MRYVYKRQVQRSSWFTFDKIAKVKGLSNVQTRLLADVVRRPKIQRPSQVLASIRLFESVIDQALDAGWISDAEISHLEKTRVRLLRTSRPWDGKNRRQFERAESPFELNVTGITKESIDLSQLRGCVLEAEQMEEQRQLILHVRFLPYDAELRKQVIRTVYESSEHTQTEAREKAGGGKKRVPRKHRAKKRRARLAHRNAHPGLQKTPLSKICA